MAIFAMTLSSAKTQATIIGSVDIDPKVLRFGETPIGESSMGTDTLTKASGFLDVLVFGSFLIHPFGFSRDGEDCVLKLLDNNNSCQIFGTFSPNRRAFYHTHLVVVGTSREVFNFATWIGRGVQPLADVDPTSIDFGEQPTDQASGPQTVTVQNVGTGELVISSLNLVTGTEFSIGNEDCTTAPLGRDATCSIEVIFGPTSTGNFSDTLEITDNAPDSPQTVALSGVGIDPGMPAITLTTSELDFDLQEVGVASAPRDVTLTNSGTADLELTGISVTTGGSDYSQMNDCGGFPATLMPGDTCTLSITFNPSVIGELLGQITITATGLSDETIDLEGIGFTPGSADFSLSSNNLDFGEVDVDDTSEAQTVTVTNTGGEPLEFDSILFGGSDPYNYTMIDECGNDPLPIGATCIIEVYFGPKTPGILNATITFIDQNGQEQSIALTGIGVGTGGNNVGGGGGFCALRKNASSSMNWASFLWLAALPLGILLRNKLRISE